MLTATRLILLAGAVLAAIPAWGNDPLPQLPGGEPSSLPTLGASSQDSVGMSDQSFSVTCYLGNLGRYEVEDPIEKMCAPIVHHTTADHFIRDVRSRDKN